MRGEPFLIVQGKLQKQDGTTIAHQIASLEGARNQFNAPMPV